MWKRILTVLALIVSAATSQKIAGETTEQKTSFGSMTIVREVRKRDPGEPPIMHVATEWTKLFLKWRSTDGVVTIDFQDDGRILKSSIWIELGKQNCLTGGFERYSQSFGEPQIWTRMIGNFRNLTEMCPAISDAQGRAYISEISAAIYDYTHAVESMKILVQKEFNRNLLRCKPKKAERTTTGVPTLIHPFADPCDGSW